MKKRNRGTEEIIEALCRGQSIKMEDVDFVRKEEEDMPDAILVFCIFIVVLARKDLDWKQLLTGIEDVYAKSQDPDQIYILQTTILDAVMDHLKKTDLSKSEVARYLGARSRAYIEAQEEWNRNPPKQKPRGDQTEEIVSALCDQQPITEQEGNILRLTQFLAQDGHLIEAFLKFFMARSGQVNWARLLGGIEKILWRRSNQEQIELIENHVLRVFSVSIFCEEFERKWIDPYLGTLSRRYIETYDLKWKK